MIDVNSRISDFKRFGYTVFEGVYSGKELSKLKRIICLSNRELNTDKSGRVWLVDLVEQFPEVLVPVVNNSTILDFAESVMGPFVQLDSLTLAEFPIGVTEKNRIVGWHRDRWAWKPRGEQYVAPWSCNAITYLQDLTEEVGPLRVIDGSHRSDFQLSMDQIRANLPNERLLYAKAGDVILTHGALLHSGTHNCAAAPRQFMSVYYNHSGLRTYDDHSGPNVQKVIELARSRTDRRLMRLFGVDDRLETRVNSSRIREDEETWETWIAEDRSVLRTHTGD